MKGIINRENTQITNSEEMEKCADCGKEFALEVLIPAPDGSRMLCEECYYKEVNEQCLIEVNPFN